MSQNRFDALTDFAYNVGNAAFCGSTLVKKLNAGAPGACAEMHSWRFITRDGAKLDCALAVNFRFCGGLIERRKDQVALCSS